jgi:hypothetical protein
LNNRSKIWDELAATTGELQEYFLEELRSLLSNPYFEEWIAANLDYTEQRMKQNIPVRRVSAQKKAGIISR